MPFDTIVGHRRLITLLARAAARDTLPPAMLMAGPAGVGKRFTAAAVAAAINCLQPRSTPTLERDACGRCTSCRRIARGVHPDVPIVEPGDNGQIGIEQIRDVIDRAQYRPFEVRRRVVIIDEADAAGDPAQSALLKTLEEPPSTSIFVLVSSMPDALLATVRSRLPRLRFGPLTVHEVVTVLTRDHAWEEADAQAAAAEADGSVGVALQMRAIDVARAREAARQVLEVTASAGNTARRVAVAHALVGGKGTPAEGREQLATCLRSLASLLRDLGVIATRADRAVLANRDMATALDGLARFFDSDRAVKASTIVDRALGALERNASTKIVADWVVLQL